MFKYAEEEGKKDPILRGSPRTPNLQEVRTPADPDTLNTVQHHITEQNVLSREVPANLSTQMQHTTTQNASPMVNIKGTSDKDKVTQQASTATQQNQKRGMVVVGNSIIRNIERLVCNRDPQAHIVCCLPGTRVKDVTLRVDKLLARAGENPVIIIHAGTSDVGKAQRFCEINSWS